MHLPWLCGGLRVSGRGFGFVGSLFVENFGGFLYHRGMGIKSSTSMGFSMKYTIHFTPTPSTASKTPAPGLASNIRRRAARRPERSRQHWRPSKIHWEDVWAEAKNWIPSGPLVNVYIWKITTSNGKVTISRVILNSYVSSQRVHPINPIKPS